MVLRPGRDTEMKKFRLAGHVIRAGLNNIRLGIAAVTSRLRTGRLRIDAARCPNLLAEAKAYRYPARRSSDCSAKTRSTTTITPCRPCAIPSAASTRAAASIQGKRSKKEPTNRNRAVGPTTRIGGRRCSCARPRVCPTCLCWLRFPTE